jgi:cell division septal protein FtsQ
MFHEKKKISWAKKEKKRNPFIIRIIFDVLLVAFLSIAAYILFFSSYLQINRLFLDGIEELDYQKVIAEINSNFEGKYLKVIPRNNFLLISQNRLKNNLMEKFKKIESIDIEKKFPNTISIKIKERKSLMLWCSGGPCYIVDERGYAYAGADFESPEIKENNLIRLVDISARPVNLGEKILSPEFVQFTLGIRDKLSEELGINIEDEYLARSAIAEEVQVKTSEIWDLYLSSEFSLGQSIKTLKLFLDEKISSDERSKLEYVDLRVEDKVYYKFKDGENVEQNNTEPQPASANNTENTSQKKKKKK